MAFDAFVAAAGVVAATFELFVASEGTPVPPPFVPKLFGFRFTVFEGVLITLSHSPAVGFLPGLGRGGSTHLFEVFNELESVPCICNVSFISSEHLPVGIGLNRLELRGAIAMGLGLGAIAGWIFVYLGAMG